MAKLNKTIIEALRKHSGQRTVLYVAIPVLDAHLQKMQGKSDLLGCSESEIMRSFRDLAKQYGHSDYHTTYTHRRLGRNGFLELNNSRYCFRESLMTGVTREELRAFRNELKESLETAFERRQALIKQLEKTTALPTAQIDERHDLVVAYLEQITGNAGEMFEVVSFAVLREYFRSFGFTLQRFSTTHANDGGMDFVAGDAIYQVTTDKSILKVRRDLAKSPGTNLVLVRPSFDEEIIRLCDAEVLATIEVKDLLEHFVRWLLSRDARSKQASHLQRVLQVALEEFRRENRAEGKPA